MQANWIFLIAPNCCHHHLHHHQEDLLTKLQATFMVQVLALPFFFLLSKKFEL